MSPAPTFSIDVPVQEGWRAGVLALLALAAVTVACWAPSSEGAGLWRIGSIVLCAVALSILGWALGASRTAARRLRWDGAEWWIGPAGCGDDQMEAGQLGVMIDLSSFMLLRFEPQGGAAWRRLRWVPVQRSGIVVQWHALRCAVYSARPRTASFFPGDLPRNASPRLDPPE